MSLGEDRAAALLVAYAAWPDAPFIPVHGLRETADGLVCTCRGKKGCARGKHPRRGAWQTEPTLSLREIASWVKRGSNVGLRMGGPNALITLDVDGQPGEELIPRLEAEWGKLPPTLASVTGRADGGRHLLFRRGTPLGPPIGNSVGRFGAGLDIRGERGQIVAEPSLHVSGGSYRWNERPRFDLIAVLPPAWEEMLVKGPSPQPRSARGPAPRPQRSHATTVERLADRVATAEDGVRNDTLNTSAFLAAGPVAAGVIPLSEAHAEMVDAGVERGLEEPEAVTTAWSGLAGGLAKGVQSRVSLAELASAGRLPPFPVQALAPVLREFVEAVAVSHEVRPDLPALLALGAIACASMGKVVVRVDGGWTQPLNLYLLAALESGEGKSPVMRRILRPFAQVERATGRTLTIKDATPEALGVCLSRNQERLGLFDDEASAISQILGRYQQRGTPPNIDIYLHAYDGDRLSVARISRAALFLDQPLLTIAVAVQTVVLQRLREGKDLGDRGLLNRFLFALPQSLVGTRSHGNPPVPPQIQSAYDDAVVALLSWEAPAGAEVRLSEAARRAHIEFLREMEPTLAPDGVNRLVAPWCLKLPGAIARLAAVLHVADHPGAPAAALADAVPLAAMQRAIEIALYFREHARAVLGGTVALPFEREVLAWALGTKRTDFSAREAKQHVAALKRHAGPAEPILQALAAGGVLVESHGRFSIAPGGQARNPDEPAVVVSAGCPVPGGGADAK